MHSIDVLVGLQHGDEGKGKISFNLSMMYDYDAFVRFNGGPNAGHTVFFKGKPVVLHHLPCGILNNKPCLLSSGSVIDLNSLQEEIDAVKELGINAEELLHISYNTHIILPEYIEEDIRTDRIGTTKRGIAPTYGRKYYRTGIRAEDRQNKNGTLLGCKVVNGIDFLKDKKKLLFEGAQGYELDIDWGNYPYVTSSSCLSGNIFLNGVPPQPIHKAYGIAKVYETYVGKKDFQPMDDNDLKKIQEVGKEYGATTGRKRQCNWLNLDRLERSCYINAINILILNKCDILKEVGIFKFIQNGKVHQVDSFEAFQARLEATMTSSTTVKEIIYSESPDKI